MIEQPPVADNEPPPDDTPLDAPPEEIASNTTGAGPAAGGGRGNGNTIGGKRRKGGSQFGWYAAKVQSSVADALRRNSSTRTAAMSMQVRIWPDSTGRITRVQLVGTSGDPAVDDAIRNRILNGLQLPQAPPAGMPSPIILRINARHPSP
jgi:outer membrane biosynthesis protein TonB